jgi:hypothetical protein
MAPLAAGRDMFRRPELIKNAYQGGLALLLFQQTLFFIQFCRHETFFVDRLDL